VGATTAYTGAFTTLSATGVTTVQAGTAAAPAITTSGDTNTGIFFPAADTIAFAEGGVEAMRLDSSGNLGIGTSSPAYKLDVYDPPSDTETIVARVGKLNAAGNSSTTLTVSSNPSTQVVTLGASGGSGKQMAFAQGGTERMRLDSSGNLGLGVTPSPWFTSWKVIDIARSGGLYADASGTNAVGLTNNAYLNSGASAWVYKTTNAATHYQQTAGQHIWFNAPSGTAGNAITFTQAMTLTAGGDLLLGGTSGSYKLNVINGKTFAIHSDADNCYAIANAPMFVATTTASPIIFQTNSAERARIDASGNFLVGTTTSAFTAKQEIVQTATNPVAYFFRNNAATNAGFVLRHGGATGAATATQVEFLRADSVTVGSITSTVSATAYNTSSDYRLKNITGPITTSGAYIDSLNPVEGTWKADGSTFVGLIAHEVQEASRTHVATGVKDGKDMQAMDYSNAELIANMLAELKSLRARVAQLEST
jgi:hypothetical protein